MHRSTSILYAVFDCVKLTELSVGLQARASFEFHKVRVVATGQETALSLSTWQLPTRASHSKLEAIRDTGRTVAQSYVPNDEKVCTKAT